MSFDSLPIEAPGGFAPVVALGHDDGTGQLALVGPATPLPTRAVGPQVPAALTGEADAAMVAGPFVPAPALPVYVVLSGTWTGTVRLLRSTDGGATRHRVTVAGLSWAEFSGNACEPVWVEGEEGAELYLELAPSSGTIAYRVAQ